MKSKKNTKGLVVYRSHTVSASAFCWIAFYRVCLLIAGRAESCLNAFLEKAGAIDCPGTS